MTENRTGHRRTGLRLLLVAALTIGVATTVNRADAATAGSPYGALSSITQVSAHYFRLTGWAVDNDNPNSVVVVTTVDGTKASQDHADLAQPTVPVSYGKHGTMRGFSVSIPIDFGTHAVCVVAANRGAGSNVTLGCRTVNLVNNPSGTLGLVRQIPGGIAVYGGASDPNTTAPIGVQIYANGTLLPGTAIANGPTYQGHGFRRTYLLPAGVYNVCATAVNVSWGRDNAIGCRSIDLNFSPVGALTTYVQSPGGFTVTGWASDPDTAAPISVAVYSDAKVIGTVLANGTVAGHGAHGFSVRYLVPAGQHRICLRALNVSFGASNSFSCTNRTLNYNPVASLNILTQTLTGVRVVGAAVDPDTVAHLAVLIYVDGKRTGLTTANLSRSGHAYAGLVAAGPGAHQVCVLARNAGYGSGYSPKVCKNITLNFNPMGTLAPLTRLTAKNPDLRVTGWALDKGSTKSIQVRATLDGKVVAVRSAAVTRTDVAQAHPEFGPAHGYTFILGTDAGEHTVCITALNVGTGADQNLGCRLIIAVHPKAPSAPRTVKASGGYGGAIISWTPPASDGGAPVTGYSVQVVPGGATVKVDAASRTATVVGLHPRTRYIFRVYAQNVGGTSAAAFTPAIVTQASPPPQTSPAPISTSRYIRNIHGSSSTDLRTMRNEGAADARANPSGHGYLILLDIGGQDQGSGGVVLSATTRFISYGDLVKNVQSYVDGYASAQRASAPVMIAIGTNNDMEVTTAAGAGWANSVIDPVLVYARKYTAITIAGANDIEPGFRGTAAQTHDWLNGYLHATSAPFVFNGSADGCAWTVTNRGCNNGWTMAGLYHLAAGAAPIRTINLPQIYNTTMAKQWKYISLTGVAAKQPRINFGGALTEWTACDQASSCYSLTGNQAWRELWTQLQSVSALRVGSLPYSTDLRIDR